MREFLAAGRENEAFDPVAAAAAYGLDGDVARAIWQRVRRETSDAAAARRRFHQEARAAADQAPPPVVGRRTLVDAEAEGRRTISQTPGRHSLISFAAREAPVAIHRKAESGVVDAKAADLVAAARMGGHPLDGALRARLGAALGAELGAVRVHTDEAADLAARALGARAFAIGEDIFFARGTYDPAGIAGQRLIAHEVAHVVQSRTPVASRTEGLAISKPGDTHEQEADDFAERFAQSSLAAQLDRARTSALETIAGPAARRRPAATTPATAAVPAAAGAAPLALRARTGPMLSRTPGDDQPAPGAPGGTASKAAAMPTVQPSPARAPNPQRTPVPPVPQLSGANASPPRRRHAARPPRRLPSQFLPARVHHPPRPPPPSRQPRRRRTSPDRQAPPVPT
jgi:hypothetical protein